MRVEPAIASGPSLRGDGDVGGARNGRAGIGSNRDGGGAHSLRESQGPQHVRCIATGRKANDDVAPLRAPPREIAPALRR